MDFEKILQQLSTGELKEYRVKPENAFAFQAALRQFGKRQDIRGTALRGGEIVYHLKENSTS
ncbi:MAG: hypothetical protein LKF01_00865 [Lactobacillus sp.]|jgi:hypothetical protein|nr:hypothetical protein [Lactobacillus sp.]MCH3906623.1 hypothetical protein [Lactobacillus sp.]MCH3989741.1 hypothetical protein [Lactobacillus sp.]MCH4068093.1 hypothetical protein [Lactobacillus sp.]MCI1304274.1 hypothetical protein [Lactobacillus sp.]